MLNNRWGKPVFNFDSSACKFICLIKRGRSFHRVHFQLCYSSTRHTFFIAVIVGDIHIVMWPATQLFSDTASSVTGKRNTVGSHSYTKMNSNNLTLHNPNPGHINLSFQTQTKSILYSTSLYLDPKNHMDSPSPFWAKWMIIKGKVKQKEMVILEDCS